MSFLRSMVFLWTLSQSLYLTRAFELRKEILDLHSSQKRFVSESENRRKFFQSAVSVLVGAAFSPSSSNALTSYSANARNMERINSGDFSGGSVYDNNPKSEAGKKRRAMVGCKTEASRLEASQQLNQSSLSEQECNKLVLGGETEFMLQALRNLDCPTCPYGIGSVPNWETSLSMTCGGPIMVVFFFVFLWFSVFGRTVWQLACRNVVFPLIH